MTAARLVAGAALLLGAVPFATASHAKCTQPAATICTTLHVACTTAEDAVKKDLNCPYY